MPTDPIHTARLRLYAQARHLSHHELGLITTLTHQPTPATPAQRAQLAQAVRRCLADGMLAEAVAEEERRHAA